MDKIEVGDVVRSYDFPEGFSDRCFVEGVVEETGVEVEGCPRYKISVVSRVWDGKEKEFPHKYVYPPHNGVPTLMGGVCSRVIKIDD